MVRVHPGRCRGGLRPALDVYELVRSLIEAGAAGTHLEDQLSSDKKCGHMGARC